MKVRELIAELSKMDAEAEVYTACHFGITKVNGVKIVDRAEGWEGSGHWKVLKRRVTITNEVFKI